MGEEIWELYISYESNKNKSDDSESLYFLKRNKAKDYYKKIREAMKNKQYEFEINDSGVELSGVQYLSLKGIRSMTIRSMTLMGIGENTIDV